MLSVTCESNFLSQLSITPGRTRWSAHLVMLDNICVYMLHAPANVDTDTPCVLLIGSITWLGWGNHLTKYCMDLYASFTIRVWVSAL